MRKPHSEKTKALIAAKMRGRRASEETKAKMSADRKGKFGLWNKGKKRSQEFKDNMSKNYSFENNPRWIDGRKSYKRLAFVKYEMARECSTCGSKEDIDVHHKDKDHSNNSEENLQILCGFHHNSLHKKGTTQKRSKDGKFTT